MAKFYRINTNEENISKLKDGKWNLFLTTHFSPCLVSKKFIGKGKKNTDSLNTLQTPINLRDETHVNAYPYHRLAGEKVKIMETTNEDVIQKFRNETYCTVLTYLELHPFP
jgi:hypothetical protein